MKTKPMIASSLLAALVLLFLVSCGRGTETDTDRATDEPVVTDTVAVTESDGTAGNGGYSLSDDEDEYDTGKYYQFTVEEAYDEATDQHGYAITGLVSYELLNIMVPEGIKMIPEGAEDEVLFPYLWDAGNGFRGMEEIRSVSFEDGFLELRVGFSGCTSLKYVTFPSTIRKIGADDDTRLFENCPNLMFVNYHGNMADWYAIEKGENRRTGASGFTLHCSDGRIDY